MPSRTFAANKSSLFANAGSNLGGGADDHLPVGGPWNGYTFISAVRFATDFSGMKRITAAKLRLRTSTQVHVGFSSAPDFYVARATSDWTANGSSSSSEGGSGWGTSPTVYPGPGKTSSGQVSKRSSTSESVWVEVDISAIVRAWAPASVEGGGGAANYGIRLDRVASGDVTEFQSYRASSNRPEIVVTYDTDVAPTAAFTEPANGSVTGTRPTISGIGSDPDGDPIDMYYIQVVQGSTVVQDYTAPGGPSFSYVPATDLPSGAVFIVMKAQAAGLWSPDQRVDIVVDRAPVVGVFTEPPATTGDRTPNVVWYYSDPDGHVADRWNLEIYQAVGGAPSGAPVWSAYDRTDGIAPTYVSMTVPTDLPGGQLLARTQVRSGPGFLWSSWSAWQPFTITLTTASVAWIYPAVEGGYLPPVWLTDLTGGLESRAAMVSIDARPPAGETITWVGVETSVDGEAWQLPWNGPPDPSWGGGAGGRIDIGIPWTGAGVTWASGRIRFHITTSGGGVVHPVRGWKFSVLETRHAIVLGDQVTDLHLVETYKGKAVRDDVANAYTSIGRWIRAQSGLDALAPGAVDWRWDDDAGTSIAAVQAELPATNAALGVLTRYTYRDDDPNLLTNGSFEDGMTGWVGDPGTTYLFIPGGPDGGQHLRIPGDGFTYYPQVRQVVEVIPGAAYRIAGWMGAFEAMTDMYIRLDQVTPAVGGVLQLTRHAAFDTALVYYESADWVVPAGVTHLQLLCFIGAAPSSSSQDAHWDGVKLIGPRPNAAGLDTLEVTWKSLG